MTAIPPKKHWKRAAPLMLVTAAALVAGVARWSSAPDTGPDTPAAATASPPPRPEEPAAPPVPTSTEGIRSASRRVYRLSQTVRLSLDISKMTSGLDASEGAEVTARSPHTEVVSETKGWVEWQEAPGAEGRWVRLRWKDAGSTVAYPGSALSRAEQDWLSAEAVKQLEGVEAYVRLDARNGVSRVNVSRELSPRVYPRLLNFLEMLATHVPGQPPAEWNAAEQDSFGHYNGAYVVEARDGQGVLLSKKKHYQRISAAGSLPGGGPAIEEKHVKNLGRARLRFSLEERRLLAAEGRFTTRIRHPLMDSDIDETYSLQPSEGDPFAPEPPPSGEPLRALLARQVEVDSRAVLEDAARVTAVRPGFVGLEPEQVARRLVGLVDTLRGQERFDPEARASRPLMEDLGALFAAQPELARHTLRPLLTSTERPVGGEVLSAVVNEALRHGPEGQGLALDVLAAPGLAEQGYTAALAGLGTREDLTPPGQDTLMRVLRQQLPSVPADIAANGPLLAGYQGALAKKAGEDSEPWFRALVDELAHTSLPERQEVLLLGLGNLGDPRTLGIAEPYLASPHGVVRLAAASALRQVPDPQALTRIFTVFLSDPSVEVRLGLVDLFNDLSPLDAVLAQARRAMSAESEAAVRKKTLAVLGGRSGSQDFVSGFLGDPDPGVRQLAQLYLEQPRR